MPVLTCAPPDSAPHDKPDSLPIHPSPAAAGVLHARSDQGSATPRLPITESTQRHYAFAIYVGNLRTPPPDRTSRNSSARTSVERVDVITDRETGQSKGFAFVKVDGTKAHFRALPYKEVGAALARVREWDAGTSVRLALKFMVCAVHSG